MSNLTCEDIRARLLELADIEYKSFHCRLIPTVDAELVIGVRTPMLRRLASELSKSGDADSFMNELPHKYYEENNLHAFLLEKLTDFDSCISELDKFLPYVDNWATCDMMSPKCFSKNTDKLLGHIERWLASEHTYTVRYAVKTLMSVYSDKAFSPEHLELAAAVKSDEYYVRMAVAWYFATELSFHYDETLPYLEEHRLDKWVHNKTIQKAIESLRISEENKKRLKSLKVGK